MKSYFVFALLVLLVSGCSGVSDLANSEQTDTTETAVPPSSEVEGSEAALFSAFFGLDDDIPALAGRMVCSGAAGADGMPVVFSEELDTATLQAGDFRVTTADGSIGEILCVTPAPAFDSGELRTILMIGQFGSADNQPATVEIVGNLLSSDQSTNFRGTSVAVTPLEDGPFLVFAEVVPESQWELGKESSRLPFGGGDGCPEATQQVVRAVWAGGVTKPGGDEVDDLERAAYKVYVESGSGEVEPVTPFAIGDLGDGDNNHELCLDTTATPVRVEFPAGLLTDPRDDVNPATSIDVTR